MHAVILIKHNKIFSMNMYLTLLLSCGGRNKFCKKYYSFSNQLLCYNLEHTFQKVLIIEI